MLKYLVFLFLLIPSVAFSANCGGATVCACGDTVTSSYTLSGDLNCTNAGPILTIGADGITLDLGGFTIDGDDTNTTECIFNNGFDNITIQNGTVKDATQENIQFAGTTDNCVFDNITSTGGVESLEISTSTGTQITDCTFNQGSSAMLYLATGLHTNPSITDNIFNGAASTANIILQLRNCDGMVFTGNTLTNVQTGATTDRTINVLNSDVVTFSNNTITGCEGRGVVFQTSTDISGTGNSITGCEDNCYYFSGATGGLTSSTATSCGAYGFRFDSTTSTMTGCTSDSATVDGFYATGTSNLTLNNCTAFSSGATGAFAKDSATLTVNDGSYHSNTVDGVGGINSSALTCNRVTAYGNGDDGFTTHDTGTLNLYYNIAYGNFNTGVGVVGASSGNIYNNVFYNNYNATNPQNIGIYLSSTGTWNVKNNITKNNEVEINITAAAVVGGITLDSDYNIFDNSRGGNGFEYNSVSYNFADYKTNSSQDANSLNTDPLMKDVANANFVLLTNSPAIDAGTDVSLTRDYTGNRVPWNDIIDMGAYENYDYVPNPATTNIFNRLQVR
jgi:hypothetical protein